MKKYFFILMALVASLVACTPPNPTHEKQETETVATVQYETVQLVVAVDHTKSFVKYYTFPDPELFKNVCDKIILKANLDFRYAVILDFSNITMDRYAVPRIQATPENKNPWLKTEKSAPVTAPVADWERFASSINSKLALPPSNESDITSAISHALMCFQEQAGTGNTRKILLLATDFKDSYAEIPGVSPDIEVLTVGVLPTTPVEQILNTKNVKRFESLESAIDYISNQFN